MPGCWMPVLDAECRECLRPVEKKVLSTKSKVSAIESGVAVVKKSAGWTFVGMGIYESYGERYSPDTGFTLAECIGICTNYRSSDSKWNGAMFRPSNGQC